MKLGWRHPRPNDFTDPNIAPLKDTFGDLQKFMTWPHAQATIPAATAVNNVYGTKTLTATDDPYTLMGAANQIQAPRDHPSWMMFGYAMSNLDGAGAGLYQIGFMLNGAITSNLTADWYSAGVVDQRVNINVIAPCVAGDYFQIGLAAPAASTVVGAVSVVRCVFLPLV